MREQVDAARREYRQLEDKHRAELDGMRKSAVRAQILALRSTIDAWWSQVCDC
jgi:hypothetical protein